MDERTWQSSATVVRRAARQATAEANDSDRPLTATEREEIDSLMSRAEELVPKALELPSEFAKGKPKRNRVHRRKVIHEVRDRTLASINAGRPAVNDLAWVDALYRRGAGEHIYMKDPKNRKVHDPLLDLVVDVTADDFHLATSLDCVSYLPDKAGPGLFRIVEGNMAQAKEIATKSGITSRAMWLYLCAEAVAHAKLTELAQWINDPEHRYGTAAFEMRVGYQRFGADLAVLEDRDELGYPLAESVSFVLNKRHDPGLAAMRYFTTVKDVRIGRLWNRRPLTTAERQSVWKNPKSLPTEAELLSDEPAKQWAKRIVAPGRPVSQLKPR